MCTIKNFKFRGINDKILQLVNSRNKLNCTIFTILYFKKSEHICKAIKKGQINYFDLVLKAHEL